MRVLELLCVSVVFMGVTVSQNTTTVISTVSQDLTVTNATTRTVVTTTTGSANTTSTNESQAKQTTSMPTTTNKYEANTANAVSSTIVTPTIVSANITSTNESQAEQTTSMPATTKKIEENAANATTSTIVTTTTVPANKTSTNESQGNQTSSMPVTTKKVEENTTMPSANATTPKGAVNVTYTTVTSPSTPMATTASTTPSPPQGCGKPPTTTNGNYDVNKDLYPFNSNITYNCNEGFSMKCSTPTAMCSSNGKWAFGKCLPTCTREGTGDVDVNTAPYNPYIVPVVAIVAGVFALAIIALLIGCVIRYQCCKRNLTAPKTQSIVDYHPRKGAPVTLSMYQTDDSLPVRGVSGFQRDSTLFSADNVDSGKPSSENSTNATSNDVITTDLDEVVVDSNGAAERNTEEAADKGDNSNSTQQAPSDVRASEAAPNFDPPESIENSKDNEEDMPENTTRPADTTQSENTTTPEDTSKPEPTEPSADE